MMNSAEELLNDNPQQDDEAGLDQPESQNNVGESTVEGGAPTAPEGEIAQEPEKEPQMVPLAAVQDERTKRQEAEKQRIEAEAKARAYEMVINNQSASQQQAPEQVDYYENPEAYTQQRIDHALQKQRQSNINALRDMAIAAIPDYQEKEDLFVQAAQQDPNLSQQALNSDNPALFAYQYAKQQQEAKKYSDPNYKEQLKAQIIAEYEAEKLISSKEEAANRSGLNASIASQRSTHSGQEAPFRQLSTEELFKL